MYRDRNTGNRYSAAERERAVAEWVGPKGCRTPCPCLKLRYAGGREFEHRPGQYSRMSFSSDQVTGAVFPRLNMQFLPNSEFI